MICEFSVKFITYVSYIYTWYPCNCIKYAAKFDKASLFSSWLPVKINIKAHIIVSEQYTLQLWVLVHMHDCVNFWTVSIFLLYNVMYVNLQSTANGLGILVGVCVYVYVLHYYCVYVYIVYLHAGKCCTVDYQFGVTSQVSVSCGI